MPTTRPSLARPSGLAVLFAAPLLAMALAACSPGAAQPSAAPSTGAASGAASGPVSAADSSAARDAYDLRLAQCISGKGVEVADPKPGEGFAETGPQVQAAASECATEIGPPPSYDFSEEEKTQLQQQYLASAECLRGLGHDVADPAPGEALALEGISDADFATCTSVQ